MRRLLALLLIVGVHLNSAQITPIVTHHNSDADTCARLASLERHEIGAGHEKIAHFIVLDGGRPGVLGMPFINGSYWRKHNDETGVRKGLMRWTQERDQLVDMRGEHVPTLFAACGGVSDKHLSDPFHGTFNVAEALRNFVSVCVDPRVSLGVRLRLAASTVRLADFFGSVPNASLPRGAPTRSVVYGDFKAPQFGVSDECKVKVVDLQAMHDYNRTLRYGGNIECTSNQTCLTRLLGKGEPNHVMHALSPNPPLEFMCDQRRQRCRGVDERTTLFALCDLMVKHLLSTFRPPQLAEANGTILHERIRETLAGCMQMEPSNRWTTRRTSEAFDSMVELAGGATDQECREQIDVLTYLHGVKYSSRKGDWTMYERAYSSRVHGVGLLPGAKLNGGERNNVHRRGGGGRRQS